MEIAGSPGTPDPIDYAFPEPLVTTLPFVHIPSAFRPTPLAALALLTLAAPIRAQHTRAPSSGAELVRWMHDRYDGKWFRTLTFVQRTTQHPPGGTERVATWYEAMMAPSRLRIDFDDPAQGNGVLYTADSTYRMRGGQLRSAVADGNPLMPFALALYTQPVERTLTELAREHYDMSVVRTDTVDGRRVFVVGAKSRDDVTSPQFWVDAERLVATRVIVPLPPSPSDSAPRVLDTRFDGYVPTGGGWLATKVELYLNGTLLQREEYSSYRADVALPETLFDPAQWSTAPHWFKAAK